MIIVGIVVLALIAAGITGGVLLTRASQTAGGGSGGGGTGGGAGQTGAPPLAVKPSDAVRSYLEALAAGNAEAALALGGSTASDTTFLTSEILAVSNKLAPITEINVPEVDDEYAYQVAASYKLGKQAVSENYSVSKSGDQWKLRDAFNTLDLSFRSSRNVPTIINGVEAKTTKVALFPGAYQFTTGSEYISWGESPLLLIQSPTDYPRNLSDLKATLTDQGDKAFRAAVSASLDKCLKSNKISNPGCPNDVNLQRITSPYEFKDGTMKWEATRRAQALEDMKPNLDYQNAAIATAFISLGLEAVGDCDASGGKCTLTPFTSLQPRATMTTEPVKVTWTR